MIDVLILPTYTETQMVLENALKWVSITEILRPIIDCLTLWHGLHGQYDQTTTVNLMGTAHNQYCSFSVSCQSVLSIYMLF